MSWKKIKQEVVVDSPFVKVELKSMQRSGESKEHGYFHFRFPDFCNVIAVTASAEIVLVRQYRMGIEAETVEIPGGVVDPDDTDASQTALRELREESGYTLTDRGRVEALGWTYPNPATQDNKCHFYLVGPVAQTDPLDNDETELTEPFVAKADEVDRWIEQGKIQHALALNGLQRLALTAPEHTVAAAVARFLAI